MALMGTDISGDADSIGHAYRVTFEYVSLKMNGAMMFTPLWMPTAKNREFRAAKALLDQGGMELIARRRAQPSTGDVLGRLVEATDEESGQGMSDEQLRDEVITLLTAGHETGGAALSWALYLLGKHPDVQEQLHDEVHAVLGAQVWDRQSMIRIWLGPLSLPQYEAFLPGGVLLRKLVDWMRLYLGFELEWDVRLLLTAAAVPHLRLGAGTRLGWTTWLGHRGNAADAGDLCLNAEAFVTRSMPATEAGVRGASGV
jgi:cytochrome P450